MTQERVTQSHQPRGRLALSWLIAFALVAVAAPMALRATGSEPGIAAWILALLPWFYLALPVAMALALATRRWLHAGASAALLAVAAAWLAPIVAPSHAGAAALDALTVATINLHVGGADADAVVALAEANGIDVLALEEVTPAALEGLERAGIDDAFPYSVTAAGPGASGTALYSTTPLAHQRVSRLSEFALVDAAVTFAGTDLRVLAAHPFPPMPSEHSAWREDLAALASIAELAGQDAPLLIAGDFNATLDHAGMRALEAQGLADAVDQAGAGFLPTFPADSALPPLVPIDHILIRSAELVATNANTFTIPGTDHRALVVTYALS